jgi:hypothetical protein
LGAVEDRDREPVVVGVESEEPADRVGVAVEQSDRRRLDGGVAR